MLSPEIRARIYSYVFWRPCQTISPDCRFFWSFNSDYLYDVDTALLAVNSRMYCDCLPIAFSCNTFWWPPPLSVFSAQDRLRTYLDNVRSIIVSHRLFGSLFSRYYKRNRTAGLPCILEWYLPHELTHITVDTYGYSGVPTQSEIEPGEVCDEDAWLYCLIVLGDNSVWRDRNLHIAIRRYREMDYTTDQDLANRRLNKLFPGCVTERSVLNMGIWEPKREKAGHISWQDCYSEDVP